MARFLLAKMASVAALISTSAMLSSCQTVAYKPIICDPGFTMKNGRCAKVTKARAGKQRLAGEKQKAGGQSLEY